MFEKIIDIFFDRKKIITIKNSKNLNAALDWCVNYLGQSGSDRGWRCEQFIDPQLESEAKIEYRFVFSDINVAIQFKLMGF